MKKYLIAAASIAAFTTLAVQAQAIEFGSQTGTKLCEWQGGCCGVAPTEVIQRILGF